MGHGAWGMAHGVGAWGMAQHSGGFSFFSFFVPPLFNFANNKNNGGTAVRPAPGSVPCRRPAERRVAACWASRASLWTTMSEERKKKTVLTKGELAFRAWAENLPVVGSGLRNVRYVFLSRMQEIVRSWLRFHSTTASRSAPAVSPGGGVYRGSWHHALRAAGRHRGPRRHWARRVRHARTTSEASL